MFVLDPATRYDPRLANSHPPGGVHELMSFVQRFWKSSIGAKLTMAVTGILLFGFVIGHLTGNLLIFQGRDAMNDYAAFLHSKPALLWVTRLGLLAVVGLHIVTAARLTKENQDARPVPYARKEDQVSSVASRSMMLTGITIAGYVVFHLAHLTWGLVLNDYYGLEDAEGRVDVYYMVTEGFKVPWVSLIWTARAAPTASPPRVASTRPRTTRTTATASYRLFYDTIKGGDFRSREANVYRLAQVSANIIDQCVAQGVPFAREYGGLLATARSAARRSRAPSTPAARPASSSCSAATRRCRGRSHAGHGQDAPAHRDAGRGRGRRHRARGIVTRDLVTGKIESWHGGRRVPCDRRLRQRCSSCPPTRWAATSPPRGALQARRALRQPLLHPDPPDLHPGHRRPPVQADPDVRVAAQRRPHLGAQDPEGRAARAPDQTFPEEERDYYLERKYPSFGNLAPRDISSRSAKEAVTTAVAWAPVAGSIWTSPMPSGAWARTPSAAATATCSRCTRRSPARTRTGLRCGSIPRRTTPWAACGWTTTCMSTIPGLFVLGEANFSDHGANRLGASALMQGLADGYFVIPYTIGHFFASHKQDPGTDPTIPEFKKCAGRMSAPGSQKLFAVQGQAQRGVDPPRAGPLDVEQVRHGPQRGGPEGGAREDPRHARGVLERRPRAGQPRRASTRPSSRPRAPPTFLEFAELMVHDALDRNESCGGHFREEYQTDEGEAQRNDDDYAYVAAWEYQGEGNKPALHKEEPLEFENVEARD